MGSITNSSPVVVVSPSRRVAQYRSSNICVIPYQNALLTILQFNAKEVIQDTKARVLMQFREHESGLNPELTLINTQSLSQTFYSFFDHDNLVCCTQMHIQFLLFPQFFTIQTAFFRNQGKNLHKAWINNPRVHWQKRVRVLNPSTQPVWEDYITPESTPNPRLEAFVTEPETKNFLQKLFLDFQRSIPSPPPKKKLKNFTSQDDRTKRFEQSSSGEHAIFQPWPSS